MTGKQLKNSILQLAIQGKLVPQDPNDEPASALLARIRKEKEQLVKEGKLKKKDLVTTPISDEEKPFEIPESWEWCRLGDVVSFVGGYAYKSSDFISSSRNQVLRLGNVKNDYINHSTSPVFISDDLATKTLKYQCKVDDILITMTGTRKKRDYFFTYRVRKEDSNLFINQRVGALRPYISAFAHYLTYALKAEAILQDVFQYETGTANQGNLGADNIQKVLIPLPPLSEQHRIVAKIEELMPLVEEYDKAQTKLDALNQKLPEALKKSILQEAIMGKLVPQDPNAEPALELLARIRKEKEQLVKDGKLKKKDLVTTPISDDEKPFEIPETWEWCRMRELCNFATPNKKEDQLVCLDARYLRGKSEGIIMSKGNYVNEGQYIILVDGENSGEVFITPCEGFLGSTFKELLITHEVSFDFLKYIFLIIKEELRQNKRGAAIPHLDKVLFFEHLIPLPPLSEQHRIVAKIEELFSLI